VGLAARRFQTLRRRLSTSVSRSAIGDKSNTKWWAEKIGANKRRDVDTTSQLEKAGWTVIRVREHEAPVDAAERVVAAVRGAGIAPPRQQAA